MSKDTSNLYRLDRPQALAPQVDPTEPTDATDFARRQVTRSGDRSTHRAYHGLYDDLLN
ncbi:MAG: hypothetical protein AAF919_07090 [Pseudomonadota bacterium]